MRTAPAPSARRVRTGTIALGLAGVLCGACGGGALPSAAHTVHHANTVRGPRGTLTAATVSVTSGFTRVEVATNDLGAALYSAHTPADSGTVPATQQHGGTVEIGQRSVSGHRGSDQVLEVELARGVRWTINLDGGASTESVDMHQGRLTALRFGAGVSDATVSLPAPDGTQMVTVAGGASRLTITAGPGSPAQIRVDGGAASLSVDGAVHTGVAGGTVYTEPGWTAAANRYLIELTAGVSDAQLTRT